MYYYWKSNINFMSTYSSSFICYYLHWRQQFSSSFVKKQKVKHYFYSLKRSDFILHKLSCYRISSSSLWGKIHPFYTTYSPGTIILLILYFLWKAFEEEATQYSAAFVVSVTWLDRDIVLHRCKHVSVGCAHSLLCFQKLKTLKQCQERRRFESSDNTS